MDTVEIKPETTEQQPITSAPNVTITQNDAPGGTVKKPIDVKKIIGIIVFIIGIATLIGGVVFLVMNVLKEPEVRDADRLVEVGLWQREDDPSVIWNFTEIGKGTLTTNNHVNDYDFIWATEGNTLKIETKWLYDLNDEFNFSLENDRLILNNVAIFVPYAEPEAQPDEKTDEEPEAQPDEQLEE